MIDSMAEKEQFQDIHQYFKNETNSVPDSRLQEFQQFLAMMVRRIRMDLQKADIDDIVQETLIKLMVMSQKDIIRTSFLGAAHWAIRNELKSYNSRVKTVDLDEKIKGTSNLEKDAETQEMIDQLRCEVEKLSDREQTIFHKHYELGMKLDDIAKEMNILPNTLSVQRKRMVKKLHNKLPELKC